MQWQILFLSWYDVYNWHIWFSKFLYEHAVTMDFYTRTFTK